MRILIILLGLILISGCTTIKIPQPVGGSRSDGIVRLTYQYNIFEDPIVDWSQANAVAKNMCIGWRYSDAQPFGTQVSHCSSWNQYGCTDFTVSIPYQCIGSPK